MGGTGDGSGVEEAGGGVGAVSPVEGVCDLDVIGVDGRGGVDIGCAWAARNRADGQGGSARRGVYGDIQRTGPSRTRALAVRGHGPDLVDPEPFQIWVALAMAPESKRPVVELLPSPQSNVYAIW